MKEEILQYIWKNRLFGAKNLQTTKGEKLEIFDVGSWNTNQGADFFNAKIRIGEILWAGDVEIHRSSSHWKRHKHDSDPIYRNVILHVVLENDCEIFDLNGREIPQVVLEIPQKILRQAEKIQIEKHPVVCRNDLGEVDKALKNAWFSQLLLERLERKTQEIQESLAQNNNHWEESFYQFLARNFGFGQNAEGFSALAKSLPMGFVGKHKDNLLQIEALLFGQAGLLPEIAADDYSQNLKNEYAFLRQKFQLSPIDSSLWRMFRLRPMNFPHIRIAQLAAILHSGGNLFSKIIETNDEKRLCGLFRAEVSEYWQSHFVFSKESEKRTKRLTLSSLESILINTVVPFKIIYAEKMLVGNRAEAVEILKNLPAEKNAVTKLWSEIGLSPSNAADSQSLLQLQKCYCQTKKCFRCWLAQLWLGR